MNYNNTRVTIENIKKNSFIRDEKYLPIVLLLPAFTFILFVVGIPMIYSLYLSFTDFTLLKSVDYNFIGLGNYKTLFEDPVFWQSFGRTILYIAITVNLEFLFGLIIANMMSHVIRGQSIMRTVMMMPMMFVNNLLSAIKGELVIIPWLVDKPLGFITILISEIWMSTPFMVIIFLAGIMAIPQEIFEAADVDGASGWHKFRHITIPSITPFIYIAMAVRSLDIAKAYDLVSIMTGGGPAHRTELVWTYVYRLAFTSQRFALGSSMSFITVLLSFAFTFYLFRNLLKAKNT